VLARGLVPFQRRSTVEFNSSPNGLGQVFVPRLRLNLMTYPKYVACINHSEPILITQSECRPGDMLHEMVSRRNVVMGPYFLSADVKNNPIG